MLAVTTGVGRTGPEIVVVVCSVGSGAIASETGEPLSSCASGFEAV